MKETDTKATYYVILCIQMSRTGNLMEIGSRLVVARIEGEEEWEMTGNVVGISF